MLSLTEETMDIALAAAVGDGGGGGDDSAVDRHLLIKEFVEDICGRLISDASNVLLTCGLMHLPV